MRLLLPEDCELLIQALPLFRHLKSLSLRLDHTCAHLKARLLSAFRCNGSLTSVRQVSIDQSPAQDVLRNFRFPREMIPFWNAEELALLQLYAKRNKKLPALLASAGTPTTVPVSLVPRMFAASLETTSQSTSLNNSIFSSLIALRDLVGNSKETEGNSEEEVTRERPEKRRRTSFHYSETY